LVVAAASALVLNAFHFPKQEHSMKAAFLFRVFLFTLKMLSVIGGMGVRAAHARSIFSSIGGWSKLRIRATSGGATLIWQRF